MSVDSLAFPPSVDREKVLAAKLLAEGLLPEGLSGEVAAAVVSLWSPAPRVRKKSKSVPWATRAEKHAGSFSTVEQEQEDAAALGRIAAGSAATAFVQGDAADTETLGSGEGLEDLVTTLAAIDELPGLRATVEFAGADTTAGELKGRARGAMRRLSKENPDLHDVVALGLLGRLEGTRSSLHVNQWLSIDLLFGMAELQEEAPKYGIDDWLLEINAERSWGDSEGLKDRTLPEGHSTLLKEVVTSGCAVRRLSVPADEKGTQITLKKWGRRPTPQDSLDEMLNRSVQVLVVSSGAVVIQGDREVVVGQDIAEDVRVEAAFGIAMTPLEAACLAAGAEEAISCQRKEWLAELKSLVALSLQFVERSSSEREEAERDLEKASSEAAQLYSRVEAAHAGLLEDRDAAQEVFDEISSQASKSLAVASELTRSLAPWTATQLRNRALVVLVDLHLNRGLDREKALELALGSSPEQVWTLAVEAEAGLGPWLLSQYLLAARPMLCEGGDEVFPMKGGRSLSRSSAERILGWGPATECHARVEQARNGRGPYRFVSLKPDMAHPCDRLAGSSNTLLPGLQRIGLSSSIPWQVSEIAAVRTLLAGEDLDLTPALACAFEKSPSPLLHEQATSWLLTHPEKIEEFADCYPELRDVEGLREALNSSFIPLRWCVLMRGVDQKAFSLVEGLESFGQGTQDGWTELVAFAKGMEGACELGLALFQLAGRSNRGYWKPSRDHLEELGSSLFVHAWQSDPSEETAEKLWLQILSTKPTAILNEAAFLNATLEMVSPRTFRRVCSFVLTADMEKIRPKERSRGRWRGTYTVYEAGRIVAWLEDPTPDEAQVIAMNQRLEGDDLTPEQQEEYERIKGVHVDRLSLRSPKEVLATGEIISKWHGRAEEAMGGLALRILPHIRTRVLKTWVKQLTTYANTDRIRSDWLLALTGSVRDSTRRWALAEALVLLDGDEEGLDEIREVGWRLALEAVDESTASRVSKWAGSCREAEAGIEPEKPSVDEDDLTVDEDDLMNMLLDIVTQVFDDSAEPHTEVGPCREFLLRTPSVAVELAAQPILELRTIGLELLQEASLTPALACRLAESGAPDVLVVCTRYLGTLEPGSPEATETVLLLCGSSVEEARGAGLEYLHAHEENTISEKVLAALAGSVHDDVRLVVATYLSDPTWDGFDSSGFDRSVLCRVRGGGRVKALVKARVERTSGIAPEVLLELARGKNRSDADWALELLSKRAIAGETIPQVVVCEEPQG